MSDYSDEHYDALEAGELADMAQDELDDARDEIADLRKKLARCERRERVRRLVLADRDAEIEKMRPVYEAVALEYDDATINGRMPRLDYAVRTAYRDSLAADREKEVRGE